ncbi:MAG: hypothetical protein ACM3MG_13905 [Bacillota bacterium]
MKNILLILAATLFANTLWAKTVSDSLVKNLSCDKISASEIYSRIDTSQFSAKYHLPITNWAFDNGLYHLANCWSMSRTQRLFFYLNRWRSMVEATPSDSKVKGLLDMIRGSIPYAQEDETWILEAPLSRLQVFGAAESNFDSTSGLFGGISTGINQLFTNNRTEKRTFRTEIEHYQKVRFSKFLKNIKYLIGSGSRSKKRNRSTRDALIENLEQNRLPMVILRTLRTTQHVVLIKRFEVLLSGDIEFYIYDPNLPEKDQRLTYKEADENFYAPEVAAEFTTPKHVKDPLGVYIVDQEEHGPIEDALVAHYTALCRIY